jgi:beta-xylosidase
VNEIFLFSYFKGHGDGLHLAWSENGIQWSALCNDEVILKPTVGKEKIMRDPCVFPAPDGVFHFVWTSGWNEQGIGYSNSKDLVNWTGQRYLPVMEHEAKARNCWAPEIFFDEIGQQFVIYWSTTIEGKFPETQPYGDDGYNHRIYFVTTPDFQSFSKTKLLYDPGFNVIDANIVRDGDSFLMFMKDETLTPPRKHLKVARGASWHEWDKPGEAITTNHFWAEGPTGIKIGPEWIVYFDKYKINKIGAVSSNDLVHWTDISDKIEFPAGAQHGYIFRAQRAVVDDIAMLSAKSSKTGTQIFIH